MWRRLGLIVVLVVGLSAVALAQGPWSAQIQAFYNFLTVAPQSMLGQWTFQNIVINGTCTGCTTGAAPADATYLTQTANASLSNEQALGALSTGILRVLTSTGVVSSLGDVLPVANGGTGISSFGTGIATFLGTPSSANLIAALTDETGSGVAVFGTGPTLSAPVFATIINSGTLTLPTGTDTLVARATTDILSNKTFSTAVAISDTAAPLVTTRNVSGNGFNSSGAVFQRDNAFGGGTPTVNDGVGFTFQAKELGGTYRPLASVGGVELAVTNGAVVGAVDISTKGAADANPVARFRVDGVGNTIGWNGSAFNVVGSPSAVATKTSGFGTGSTVVGNGNFIRITLGTTPGTSGVAAFNTTYSHNAVFVCQNEVHVDSIKVTPTPTQITVTYTVLSVATDTIACVGGGY